MKYVWQNSIENEYVFRYNKHRKTMAAKLSRISFVKEFKLQEINYYCHNWNNIIQEGNKFKLEWE